MNGPILWLGPLDELSLDLTIKGCKWDLGDACDSAQEWTTAERGKNRYTSIEIPRENVRIDQVLYRNTY